MGGSIGLMIMMAGRNSGIAGLHLENFPRGGENRFWGAMHLATLMYSRLCHLLYNDSFVLLEFQGR